MKDATLIVNLHSAQNMVNRNHQPINAYFVLSCEGQRDETEFSSNPQYFEIQKNVEFQIKIGDEPLIIKMIDAQTQNEADFEGIINIPLTSLSNQQPQECQDQYLYDQNDD